MYFKEEDKIFKQEKEKEKNGKKSGKWCGNIQGTAQGLLLKKGALQASAFWITSLDIKRGMTESIVSTWSCMVSLT